MQKCYTIERVENLKQQFQNKKQTTEKLVGHQYNLSKIEQVFKILNNTDNEII